MRAEGVLRRLGAADLAPLAALEQAAQRRPWSAAQLDAALADEAHRVVGIEVDGELVGHAVMVRLPFEAELQAMLVAPAWRRRGLATRLLAAGIDQARRWGSERLLLEVRAGNRQAIALYRGAGFVEEGRRRGYYPALAGESTLPGAASAPREDALLMSRRP
jgi:[ribosomal protein S18]-alanine N-acetyltransferase